MSKKDDGDVWVTLFVILLFVSFLSVLVDFIYSSLFSF